MLSKYALAKINLTLRVHHKRADGFHELTSLVAFANFGDEISVQQSDHLQISYTGFYGDRLRGVLAKGAQDNILLRAVRLMDGVGAVHIGLEKNLPLMAGMGGGSADAAAGLKLLNALWRKNLSNKELSLLALELGSDVPVCLLSRAAWMKGRGEHIRALNSFPTCAAVVINTALDMPTGSVFAEFDRDRKPALGQLEQIRKVKSTQELFTYVLAQGNDLLAPAMRIAPEIGVLIEDIKQTGAQVSSMSGSGATCFGLFDTFEAAKKAAHILSEIYPTAFIQSTLLS